MFPDLLQASQDAVTQLPLSAEALHTPGAHTGLLAEVQGPDTSGLASWLRNFFGPLFLVVVSIVAIFFLFTREITRFAQFIILAILIGVIFYVPGIIETTARAIAGALGVS
ncbi:hypothetical protein [Allonocardiopsis opalescens]|uniref:Uncharacterized protein n=1 Tax=Allonocardiopsis opalescens TaxID=1144618 RepID=A0A2T0QDG4_9ACTN|nr:hypothetical protein [Allonocardiopsis opalescens]PRY01932.1 hypothetical protein CLV72_101530 [Allonocardiopsis opalescens]